MPRKKKIHVTGVFSLGLLACITSIIRLIYSIELLRFIPTTVAFQLPEDKIGLLRYFFWSPLILSSKCSDPSLTRIYFSFAEIALGIVVGCSPILPRFFKQLSLGSSLKTASIKLRLLLPHSDDDESSPRSSSWLRFLPRHTHLASDSEGMAIEPKEKNFPPGDFNDGQERRREASRRAHNDAPHISTLTFSGSPSLSLDSVD